MQCTTLCFTFNQLRKFKKIKFYVMLCYVIQSMNNFNIQEVDSYVISGKKDPFLHV